MLALALALAPTPTPLSPPVPPAEIELTWRAPEGCPSGEEVIARYEELLTTAPTGEGLMVAEAVIEADEDGLFRLELVTRMGDYTDVRKLRAARCGDLGEASAMLFAVALEPMLDSDAPSPPEPEPPPAPIPEPEPTPPPEGQIIVESPRRDEPVPLPRTRRPLYLIAGIGPEGGAVPAITARISAGVGYAWTWARAEGELVWYAPQERQGSFGPASVQVAGVTARGCGVPGTERVKFPVCAGAEAGATIARVSAGDGRRSTVVGRWFAPLLRAGIVVQWPRIGGFAAFEGAGPTLSTLVRVDDDTIFEATAGSLRGIVGVELYFF